MSSDSKFYGVFNAIQASWWQLWLARIFGHKTVTFEDCGGQRTVVVSYRWCGVLYVTDARRFDIGKP